MGVNLGRRRRKVVRVPKKRLPTIFSCPVCGKESVKVKLLREENRATVNCGNCSASDEFQIKQAFSEIDVYCMFNDKIYGKYKKASI